MASNIAVKDALSVNQTVKTTDTAGVHTPHQNVDTLPPLPVGANHIGQVGVDNAAGASAVNIQDGGNIITVDGTVVANAVDGSNRTIAVGPVAVDSPRGSSSPLLTGARASTAVPTAVSLDGDVQDLWLSRNGAANVIARSSDGTVAQEVDSVSNAARVTIYGQNSTTPADTASSSPGFVSNGLIVRPVGQVPDNTTFTDGTTPVIPVGFIFDEAAGTALTENDAAAARIDSKRAQVGVIEDATVRGRRVGVSASGALFIDGGLGGTMPVSDGGTSFTVDQPTASLLNAEVQGDAAHDAPVSGNPVRIGAKANANEPAVVNADGDTVDLWADLFGRLVVLTGHPNPEPPVSVNATASGNTTVIVAPGAGSLYICKGSVHNRAATNRVVRLEDGAAGTIRWRAELAAEGGGAPFDFGSRGWKLTATTLLNVNLDAAGDVDINVTEYYIAA